MLCVPHQRSALYTYLARPYYLFFQLRFGSKLDTKTYIADAHILIVLCSYLNPCILKHPGINSWLPIITSISALNEPPTLYVSPTVLRRSTIDARYVRQLIVAEDGGTIGLDYYHGEASELSLPSDAPVLFVLHGVSGALY